MQFFILSARSPRTQSLVGGIIGEWLFSAEFEVGLLELLCSFAFGVGCFTLV